MTIIYKCTKHYNIYKGIYIKHKHSCIKVIKNHIYTTTKVIKNAKLIVAWVELNLLIVMGLMK